MNEQPIHEMVFLGMVDDAAQLMCHTCRRMILHKSTATGTYQKILVQGDTSVIHAIRLTPEGMLTVVSDPNWPRPDSAWTEFVQGMETLDDWFRHNQ